MRRGRRRPNLLVRRSFREGGFKLKIGEGSHLRIMATDITIYIEKWTPESGWKFIGSDDDIFGEFLKRNYALYAVLANESEDFEWVDDQTTRGLIPISPARGIPKDADPEESYAKIKYKKDPYGRWYPSWVTLKEILEYPHWDKFLFIDDQNKEKYRDRCSQFVDEFVPKLQELTDHPTHLRLVYDFW